MSETECFKIEAGSGPLKDLLPSRLSFERVTFGYAKGGSGSPIFDKFSFRVSDGEFVSVLGPSGGGKSTLLKLTAGLLKPDLGDILLEDRKVFSPGHDVGTVFQKPTLLPWRTVRDNVLLPAGFGRGASSELGERADSLLKTVGLSGASEKYPHQLSGGMAQRVGIARMLLHDPSLLLLDEPFSALDAMTREDLSFELQSIWLKGRKTAIFVTHSIPEAILLSDRIVVLGGQPAKIIADIAVPLERPRTIETLAMTDFNEIAYELRRLFRSNLDIEKVQPCLP